MVAYSTGTAHAGGVAAEPRPELVTVAGGLEQAANQAVEIEQRLSAALSRLNPHPRDVGGSPGTNKPQPAGHIARLRDLASIAIETNARTLVMLDELDAIV